MKPSNDFAIFELSIRAQTAHEAGRSAAIQRELNCDCILIYRRHACQTKPRDWVTIKYGLIIRLGLGIFAGGRESFHEPILTFKPNWALV